MTNPIYITAIYITANRCTVTGCYRTEGAAQAAVESDDESGVFESQEGEIAEGTRAYHDKGECWSDTADAEDDLEAEANKEGAEQFGKLTTELRKGG